VTAVCRHSLCVLMETATLATQPTIRLCCYKERVSTLWYVQNHCHFHIVVNSVCNRMQHLVLVLICVLDEAVSACCLWYSESTASTSEAPVVPQESLLTTRQGSSTDWKLYQTLGWVLNLIWSYWYMCRISHDEEYISVYVYCCCFTACAKYVSGVCYQQ
jgi:hypothetical protein